jgi:glucokinase
MEYTIGIDLGGTNVKIGLLKKGILIENTALRSLSTVGLAPQLPEMEEAIDHMMKSNQISPKEILGIGFSFAGLVDSSRNKILSTSQKYDDAVNIDLVNWAKSKWNLPLCVENDARMALLGEWQHGRGIGYNDFVMITYGTGIGSAVLMDGKLLHGRHFQAGNLGGHFVIDFKGRPCSCGGFGCVEAEASSWRLPLVAKEYPGFDKSSLKDAETLDYKTLILHAGKNDKVAKEVLDRCLTIYTAGIVNMIHAFDPEIILIGGGIMKSSDVILPELQQRVDRQAWTPWGKVKLLKAKHLETAALYGADYLVRSTYQNSVINA